MLKNFKALWFQKEQGFIDQEQLQKTKYWHPE